MTIFQATSKSKDEINHLGKVILEAAKKDAKKKGNKSSSTNLTAKEKEIREKLVLKLKKKAEGDINRQQIKVNRAKNDDFESVSDADLSEDGKASNDEMARRCHILAANEAAESDQSQSGMEADSESQGSRDFKKVVGDGEGDEGKD